MSTWNGQGGPQDHPGQGQQEGQPYGQAPYGQVPYGQVPYGQPQYGQVPPVDPASPGYGWTGHPQPGTTPQVPQMSQLEFQQPWRPSVVNAAFAVWLLIGAISVADIAVGVVVLNDSAAATGSGAFRNAIVTWNVLVALVLIGSIFAMRAGQAWARILLTVLAGITIFTVILQLPDVGEQVALGGAAAADMLLSVSQALVSLVALVLMYLPKAGAYFRT